MPGYANPQNLNRYGYVTNNPLRYADPSGHSPCEEYQGVCLSETQMTNIWNNTTGNGNNNNNNNDDGDDEPPGHDYKTTDLVCLAVFTCTEEEVENYATMFQYPGQWPWSPVIDLHHYDVFPAVFWGIPNPVLGVLGMGNSGAIWVDISENHLAITNYTESSHIFHIGDVERSYRQGIDGDSNWYVTTHGTGTNDTPHYGTFIDQTNDAVGPVIFQMMDAEMLIYTTIDQLPAFFLEQASSLLR